MTMINDLLRRVPILTLVPVVIWAFGMTVYVATWKAQTEYKIDAVFEAITKIEDQNDRVIAMEQKIIYLADSVRELKETIKEESK